MSFMQLLASRKNPEHQVEDAVRNNDVTALDNLLRSGVDPDLILHKHGGDRAVHVAAILGHFRCIETLISAGADVESANDVEVTPLFNSARSRHPRAMKVLLRHSACAREITQLWQQQRWHQILVRQDPDVKLGLLMATPDINKVTGVIMSDLIQFCKEVKDDDIAMLLIMSDISRQMPDMRSLLEAFTDGDSFHAAKLARFKAWYEDFIKTPSSLKHQCRLAIRRSFHGNCNVYYGVQNVVLPDVLREFVLKVNCCS